VQLCVVLEISRKSILLTNVLLLLLLLLLLLQKQLAVVLSLFIFSLFLETVPLLYGINIYISMYDAVVDPGPSVTIPHGSRWGRVQWP
jgi:hypothetical protein